MVRRGIAREELALATQRSGDGITRRGGGCDCAVPVEHGERCCLRDCLRCIPISLLSFFFVFFLIVPGIIIITITITIIIFIITLSRRTVADILCWSCWLR